MFRNSYSDVVKGARRAPDCRRKSSIPKAAAALAWEPSPASPSPTLHPSARPPPPKPSAFPSLNAGIEIDDDNVCKPLVSMSRSWAAATKGSYSRHSFSWCQRRQPDKHSEALLNLPSHNSSHHKNRNADVYSQKSQAHQNLKTWIATTKSSPPPKRQNIWRPLPEADRLRTSEGLQRSPITAPFHFFLRL